MLPAANEGERLKNSKEKRSDMKFILWNVWEERQENQSCHHRCSNWGRASPWKQGGNSKFNMRQWRKTITNQQQQRGGWEVLDIWEQMKKNALKQTRDF